MVVGIEDLLKNEATGEEQWRKELNRKSKILQQQELEIQSIKFKYQHHESLLRYMSLCNLFAAPNEYRYESLAYNYNNRNYNRNQ